MARSLARRAGSRRCSLVVGAVAACGVWTSSVMLLAEVPQFKLEVQVDSQAVPAGNGAAIGDTRSAEATHHQVKFIVPAQGEARLALASFCLTKDGKIVAVLNRQDAEQNGGNVLSGIISAITSGESSATASDAKSKEKPSSDTAKIDSPAQVRILDADGKLLDKWPVDFTAQAVNLCPDGNLILGGDGVLARYDLKGKQLARQESPHMAASRKDPDELKQRAKETLGQQRDSISGLIKSLEDQKAELAKREDSSLTEEERQMKQQADQILATYKLMAKQQVKPITEQEINQMAEQLAGMGRKINAVAASDKHLFCTAPASKGFGYSVWRTELDFSKPERIVDGLSGCCGQMDIQCCGDDVVVSENSRKRVVRYNSTGKQVDSWGKASRDGEGDTFGSCCNPMNTRVVGEKLYVSDSDGRVRLFTLNGKYEGEVGKANVEPGCKSSIVEVSPSGKCVYYFDVNHARICALDQKPANNAQASR